MHKSFLKYYLIVLLFTMHCSCFAQSKFEVHTLLYKLRDSNQMKVVAHDEINLGSILDSMENNISKNEDADSVYAFLDVIAHYVDGANAEVLAIASFDIFL